MGTALRRNVPAITASALVTVAVAATAVAGAGIARAAEKPAAATKAADGLTYLKIKEPFTTPVGRCDEDGTTIEMTNCVLKKVVSTDRKIDALQKKRFDTARTTKQRKAYLKNDATWLKNRTATVKKVGQGGTIDAVLKAQETLKLSKKRLNALG
ncbi:hypothetical protein KIH74_11795 [Kineosporia sp. J2-2]|uniref:Lysozyme inhibitor LprI-like N-terminal domain-containing protein n=1 Tax=Kineosporia corallincola TaxID=2835133 RepID=A0ABS5TEV1_9ACTN|nr:lysozyme inhibitor LprI family protein [Kineosporia corallincola]MBT0769609.1 hypothetical protein [Kineosporia corallincola]